MNKANNYTVYKHTAPNGKVYIGVTKQEVSRRWKNGFGYSDNEYFFKAIKKYGWNNFKHEIICEELNKEEAEQKEIELIAKYKSNNKQFGYNIYCGGNLGSSGCFVSEETKLKLRNSHLGEKNNFFGKHHSEKTKLEHSDFMKGNDYFKIIIIQKNLNK